MRLSPMHHDLPNRFHNLARVPCGLGDSGCDGGDCDLACSLTVVLGFTGVSFEGVSLAGACLGRACFGGACFGGACFGGVCFTALIFGLGSFLRVTMFDFCTAGGITSL